ncbi:unnamed protein product, partial [Polarella glacialis]
LGKSASAGILASACSPLAEKDAWGPLGKLRLNRSSCGQGPFYQTPFEAAYRDVAEQRNFRKLEALFVEADADGSGEMSLDEFRAALRKDHMQKSFSLLGVQPHQAEVVFKRMNKNN